MDEDFGRPITMLQEQTVLNIILPIFGGYLFRLVKFTLYRPSLHLSM